MNTPLFRTKLYVPAARAELVVRPRLFERLTVGLACKLIMISAPAGYGKTTLLSAWAATCGVPVAWLSLDEHDNDPARFLTYLTAAFRSAGVYSGTDPLRQTAGMLQSFQPIRMEELMPVLIEPLDSMAGPFMLVLDDYHLINHPEIHKAVSLLIDYQPAQMHFAISTREDPPLPLSRLRARGQLLELRQLDLRFTPEETAAFMSRWGGMEFRAGDAAVLTSRTEGWVAGLQMAALALQRALLSDSHPDREDIPRIVASFGGSHEYIVDYFNTEVFAQQPEVVKTFLLQTSILDQLCGSLCEAVTGQSEGQQMLERLQKANLFVTALDQERHWYRYHHLFRDLLQKQLQQQAGEVLPELHRRAIRWYEEHGMIDQVFQHAEAVGDHEKIAWIIDEYTEALWTRGELATLLHRINALSSEQLEARGEIVIGKALILATNGDWDEAEQNLSQIEHTLQLKIAAKDLKESCPDMNPVRQPGHLLGLLAYAHAQMAVLRGGNPQAVLNDARQALDHLAKYDLPWDIPWKCQILITMSDAYLLIGDILQAIEALAEAIPYGKAYHHHALLLEALTKQAMAYWMQGNFSQAARVCQEGLAYIAENDLGHLPISAGLLILQGWLQTERNELEPALESLQQGLRICQASSQPYFDYFAYIALLRFWLAKGELDTAETFVQPAETLSRKKKSPFWLETILSGVRLQLLVKQGRLAEAEQLMIVPGFQPEGEIFYPYQPLFYAFARLSLAKGDLPGAVTILDRLLSQPAQQVHWTRLVWITRALISMQQNNIPQAIESLSIALSLAARDRCIQVFLDEGEPMSLLLREYIQQRPDSGFARQLLQAFTRKALPAKPAGGNTVTQGTQNMLDPLSQRELEILGLIAEGLTNQQIATRLYLSLRTVKFHTSNIYGKLEVENRTEAVARARKLKLIA